MRKGIFGLVVLVLALPASLNPLSAQMNYRPGKVVTLEGDILEGWIRDQGSLKSLKYCKFKPDLKTPARIYPAAQLQSYEISGYKRFVAMDWQKDTLYQRIFAEVLLAGELELYENWRNKNLRYILRKENGNLMALQCQQFTYRKDGDQGADYYAYGEKYEGFLKFYRDSLMNVFSDDPVSAAMVDETDYQREPLMDLTQSYALRKYGDEGISYRKNTGLTRDRFGFMIGGMLTQLHYLDAAVESDLVYSIPVGLFYQIPLSWFSERLSFQIEANYRYLEYDPLQNLPANHDYRFAKTHVVGIPLLLSYRMSVKSFSPTIGAGKELGFNVASDVEYHYWDIYLQEDVIDSYDVHLINKGAWFAELGFDWELGPKMAFFAKARIQRYRNKFIPLQSHNNINFNVAVGDESYSNALYLFAGLRF